jgi:hypothetical protein
MRWWKGREVGGEKESEVRRGKRIMSYTKARKREKQGVENTLLWALLC